MSVLSKEKEHEIMEEEEEGKKKSYVEEVKQGEYYFDLIKLQLEDPEVSSKKALLPFIETTAFDALKISLLSCATMA